MSHLASPPPDPHPSEPLVERAGEVAALLAVLDAASRGTGATALVRGIGGIGKSTLLDVAAREASDRGWLVLRAVGDALEQEFAFGVALQLFEPVLRERGPEAAAELFEGPAALARPLLTSHGERLPDESGLFSTLHGLHWLLVDLAADGPVAVVVDDAQWADLASLRFLAYLARRIADQPVAVLAASRPLPPGPRASTLSVLGEGHLLEPRPLSPQGLARVVRSTDHRLAVDDEVLDRWWGLTGGVPLFIEELLRADGPFRDGDVGVDHHLATVQARLAKLSPAARRLAEAAAIVGDGAPIWQAQAVGAVEGAIDATQRELVEAVVLADAPTVRFVHPVIREAIVDALPAAEAARLHGELASLLVDTGAPVEVVAHELMATAPVGSEARAEVLQRAAARARSSGSTTQAVAWLQRALDERPSAAQRVRIQGELAVLRAATGDERWHLDLEAHLAATSDARARAEVQLRLGRALGNSGPALEAADLLQEAIDEARARWTWATCCWSSSPRWP
ncbi:MAG: AAA family ATPase [Acidimicrobiales bacterium]